MKKRIFAKILSYWGNDFSCSTVYVVEISDKKDAK